MGVKLLKIYFILVLTPVFYILKLNFYLFSNY